MILTVDEVADCQTDLYSFSKTVFKNITGNDFLENWHHKILCDVLEDVLTGKVKRLIINIPPRYSKTEIAVVNFISWAIGLCPDSEFIHASYSKRLASNNTWRVKAIVESDTYREIFPYVELRPDAQARDEWRTTNGGVVYATGSEGTITGFGAGKMRKDFGGAIIIDDPHKANEAHSDIRRNNVIDWFSNTIESRANSPHTPIIVIMQRLHEEDLSGFLLNGGNGEEWEHLLIPVLDDNDIPLWEDKHNLKALQNLKDNSPYVFAGQYMQKPSPKGGGIFKEDWWKFYKVLPNVEYKIITGDTAQKTKEHNDFSVFQCWGYLDGNIYLVDQIRGKWEAPELKIRFVAFYKKHYGTGTSTRGGLRNCYIEDKSSGTGLIQDIIKDKDYPIPMKAIQRNIDKVTRSMDKVPYICSGYVYVPEDSEFINDYLAEFSRFTPLMNHKHDDQIDPTLDAIEVLLQPPKFRAGTW